MGNIVDYVKEIGKISLAKRPFNSVDSLVLSELSYFKYDDILSESKEEQEGLTMWEISHIEDLDRLFQGLMDVSENRALLLAVANSRRFGKMRLKYYVNRIDREHESQFSAVTFFLEADNIYIAFRGTDETLIGWKEDFNMGFLSPVPAQSAGLAYLESVTAKFQGDCYVGGHSKGGNIAVYAAMQASLPIQKRIRKIYSHDGPGFKDAIFDTKGYQAVKDKICKLIPSSSIVGLLLQHQEEHRVVRSSKLGVLQHDPLTWIVEKGDYLYLDEVDKKALLTNQTLNQWIASMTEDARKELVDIIFGILEASDLDTTSAFTEEWRSALTAIINAGKGIDEETGILLKETFRQLIHMGRENLKAQLHTTYLSQSDT
ncbi:MAG: DUF2974 domain-containing protein [Lachnospiraceae bacterium]